MANNLLQVYCKKCSGMVCLAKFYPSTGWYTDGHEGRLNQFYEAHENSCWDMMTDYGLDQYAFRTEMDDDGLLSLYDTDSGHHKVVPDGKASKP